MTDWRDLPAGAELDALVAERVLGWSNCHIGPTYRKAMGIPPEQLAKQPLDRTINFPCHYYSQAIGCAWEVVEAMDARGHTLVLYRLRARNTWKAEFSSACCQEAETAPMAICRASLAALEMVAMEAAS